MSKASLRLFRKISKNVYSFKLKDNNEVDLELVSNPSGFCAIEAVSHLYNKSFNVNTSHRSFSNSQFFSINELKKNYPNLIHDDENNKIEKNKYKKLVSIYSNMVLNDILCVLDEPNIKYIMRDDVLKKVLYDIGKITDILVLDNLLKDLIDSYFKSMKYRITKDEYDQYIAEAYRGMYVVMPLDGNIKNPNASNLVLVNNFDMYSYDEAYNRIVNNYSKEEIKLACLSQHSGDMKILS